MKRGVGGGNGGKEERKQRLRRMRKRRDNWESEAEKVGKVRQDGRMWWWWWGISGCSGRFCARGEIVEGTGSCKDRTTRMHRHTHTHTHVHTLQLQRDVSQGAHSAKMTVNPTDAFTCWGNVWALWQFGDLFFFFFFYTENMEVISSYMKVSSEM